VSNQSGVRKRTIPLGILVASVVGLALFLRMSNSPWVPYVSRSAVPPPVLIKLQTNREALRVCAGCGVFFILPDGSLWRWGPAGGFTFSRALVPEQVGTNTDWVEAWPANDECIGLRADGSLWHWGIDFAAPLVSATPFRNFISSPEEVGSQHDWVSVATGDQHSVALKRDGTLWGWGHDELGQMGNGLGPKQTNTVRVRSYRVHPIQTNLVQIGTNHDWVAIACAQGSDTVGLRSDGTLWVWGQVKWFWNHQPGAIFAVPTQICRETNWIAIEGGLAFNRNHEVWLLFQAPPDASESVAKVCRLLAAHCEPGRFAFAAGGLYQLRADGTLWTAGLSWEERGGLNSVKSPRWHKVGERSDWISLQGGMGTALGLTGDGTLWMWGTDEGQEGVMPLSLKVTLAEERLMTRLGIQPANPHNPGWITPIQKSPRPLMRFEFQKPALRRN
jgi:hypothetical protein